MYQLLVDFFQFGHLPVKRLLLDPFLGLQQLELLLVLLLLGLVLRDELLQILDLLHELPDLLRLVDL